MMAYCSLIFFLHSPWTPFGHTHSMDKGRGRVSVCVCVCVGGGGGGGGRECGG